MLTTIIDAIVSEAEKLIVTYRRHYGKPVEAVMLAGGTATLPGIERHIHERLQIPVSRVNPFQGFRYPEELKPTLEEIGPSFAVAVGLALRGVGGPSA